MGGEGLKAHRSVKCGVNVNVACIIMYHHVSIWHTQFPNHVHLIGVLRHISTYGVRSMPFPPERRTRRTSETHDGPWSTSGDARGSAPSVKYLGTVSQRTPGCWLVPALQKRGARLVNHLNSG